MFFRKRDHYGLNPFFRKSFTKTILGFSILDIYKCPRNELRPKPPILKNLKNEVLKNYGV